MICLNCNKYFFGYKNQKYCSIKCRDHVKWLKRKNDPNYKRKQKARSKKYEKIYKTQRKIDRNKRQKTKPYRDRQNKWRKDRKYWLYQYAKNPESNRAKSKKFRLTSKGKLNDILNNERRRKKFPISLLTKRDLEYIKQRDKKCVYCQNKFIKNKNNPKFNLKKLSIDHFNCNYPLSITNAVCCCQSCNASKRNISLNNLFDWINRKKFHPSPIVYILYNRHLTIQKI